jgi:hypothetical protein
VREEVGWKGKEARKHKERSVRMEGKGKIRRLGEDGYDNIHVSLPFDSH